MLWLGGTGAAWHQEQSLAWMSGREEERDAESEPWRGSSADTAEGFVCLREAFPRRGFENQPLIRSTADLPSDLLSVRESFTIVNQEN